jgi:hypothetical protein
MTQIPKKYLCHPAALTVSYEPDKWGKPVASASSPLDNVRFEPVYRNENITSQNGARITARVFVDRVNSSCGLPLLNVGDEYDDKTVTKQTITFNGHEYNVEEIKTFYDDRKIHHWEVLLSG